MECSWSDDANGSKGSRAADGIDVSFLCEIDGRFRKSLKAARGQTETCSSAKAGRLRTCLAPVHLSALVSSARFRLQAGEVTDCLV